MGKTTIHTHTHSQHATSKRELKRVCISVDYLLRERLGWETNPSQREEPQPLSKVEVFAYLQDVVRTAEHAATTTDSDDADESQVFERIE